MQTNLTDMAHCKRVRPTRAHQLPKGQNVDEAVILCKEMNSEQKVTIVQANLNEGKSNGLF